MVVRVAQQVAEAIYPGVSHRDLEVEISFRPDKVRCLLVMEHVSNISLITVSAWYSSQMILNSRFRRLFPCFPLTEALAR